jgi:uncharacterized membrane protein YphA (DoxX/SURF4 family)
MSILKTTGVWALTVFLALFFLSAGYKKLTGNEITAGHFREWGYAQWLLILIGSLEVIGAALLLVPGATTSAALLLALIMVGASYTLLSHEVWRTLAITTTCFVLLLFLGYLRWNQSWVLALFKMNT